MTPSRNDDPITCRLVAALNALRQGSTTEWADMFSPSGKMIFPYAPPGYPSILEGKDAIADYIRSYPDNITLHTVSVDNVFRAGETRVIEFHVSATAVTTARDFVMKYVSIIEVVNGQIETYRDYWNPLVALEAMGDMETLNRMGQINE